MIKGFETTTHELSEFEETVLLPLVVGKICNHKGKGNAITGAQLLAYAVDRGITQSIGGPRMRKIIEHIRQNNLLEGLIAGWHGYYIAETPEELNDWIISMKQRIYAMNVSMASVEQVYKRMTAAKTA